VRRDVAVSHRRSRRDRPVEPRRERNLLGGREGRRPDDEHVDQGAFLPGSVLLEARRLRLDLYHDETVRGRRRTTYGKTTTTTP
jgi:hypothetical protein